MVHMGDEIGQRIAALRGSRSQEEVAKDLRISREKLSMWEQGRRMIKVPDIVDLATYFKVSADYLIFGVQNEQVDVHRDLGLTSDAVEQLKQFKLDDHVLGMKDRSTGKCVALSKALASRYVLELLSGILSLSHGERGYHEATLWTSDSDFYNAELSPDSYVALSYHWLQLRLEAIRTNNTDLVRPYPPYQRRLERGRKDVRDEQKGDETRE